MIFLKNYFYVYYNFCIGSLFFVNSSNVKSNSNKHENSPKEHRILSFELLDVVPRAIAQTTNKSLVQTAVVQTK